MHKAIQQFALQYDPTHNEVIAEIGKVCMKEPYNRLMLGRDVPLITRKQSLN